MLEVGCSVVQAVTDMDSAHFKKLCNDCGLLDKHTGITEIDLVFCYVSGLFGQIHAGPRQVTDPVVTVMIPWLAVWCQR